MKMEAEIGAMLARAGKHLGLSEAGRAKEGSFARSFVGIWYCWQVDFRLLAWSERCCFKAPSFQALSENSPRNYYRRALQLWQPWHPIFWFHSASCSPVSYAIWPLTKVMKTKVQVSQVKSRSVVSASLRPHGLSMHFSRPEYCSR